jgi:murein DD-endopeptidase MepM/ murein hydrolase activator NlpD
MLLKVSNYNHMRADREALQTNYKILENVVKHTSAQLNSLESLASEVALSYGLGRTQLLEAAPLTLATQSKTGAEASYNASLYTFNRIEQSVVTPSRNPLFPALVAGPGGETADIPGIWPVQGEVTAGFGERADPFSGEDAFHPGVDIAAPAGTPVRAAADGIVLEAGREDAGYGNEIVIDHGYGIATRYGHLRRIFILEGQEVKQGQIIGTVGMTGRATGPHLHYEVLVHETPVNPARYLKG